MQQDGCEDRLDAWTPEAQGRHPVVVNDDRLMQGIEDGCSDRTIVTNTLDVEKASGGVEADLLEVIEVDQSALDTEVVGVLITISVRRAARPSLKYCLIRECSTCSDGCTPSVIMRILNREVVRLRRLKINCTWSRRPMSRFSRMIFSIRP